jgi:putative thiamine transport system permease protein
MKNSPFLLALFPVGLFLTGALTILSAFLALTQPLSDISSFDTFIQPWTLLLQWPGLMHSVGLSLWSAIAATLISLWLALALCGQVIQRASGTARAISSAILAMPHIALATGLILLLSPSGWLLRLISPIFTGFVRPPDWPIVNDPYALSLILLLVIKETPFLFLMAFNISGRIDVARQMQAGNALGYHSEKVWWLLLVPQILVALRLPLFCVLAFGLSTVDIAILLGPQQPTTLALLVWQWISEPSMGHQSLAAAGTLLLMVITLASFGAWRYAEKVWLTYCRNAYGQRRNTWRMPLTPLWTMGILLTLGAYAVLFVWSVAWRWPFSSSFPLQWSYDYWLTSVHQLSAPIINSLLIASVANLLGLLLCVGFLEWQFYTRRNTNLWLLLAPLLIPQISLIFGLQHMAAWLDVIGLLPSVIFAHMVFIVPYYFLSLSGAWQTFDSRLIYTAQSLGKSPWTCFWRIKIPLLSKPLALSVALGFAVSMGLYLPTLGLGAGRFPTLATETVAYASGIDRRMAAVAALWQTFIPLLVYGIALFLPFILTRNKKL